MRLGWRRLWPTLRPDLEYDSTSAGPGPIRFIIPVAVVLAVQFALRMSYAGSVEPDDADLVLYTQRLAWGYSDQGPLYTWLCELFFRVFGVGVVALTAMRTAVLATGCALLYRNARLLCRDRHLASLATFAVLLIPNLSWHALAYLTHTNLLLVSCLATLYAFLRLMRGGQTFDYALFGIACGAGVLSKYNFIWFATALIVAGLSIASVRRRLLDVRIVLSLAVGALMVLPHALWVLDNLETIRQVLQIKTHRARIADASYLVKVARGTRDAVSAGVFMIVPISVVVALCFPRSQSVPDSDADRILARRVLGRFFALVLVIVFAQIALLGVSRFHERWLQPFVVVFPLWLFAGIDPSTLRAGRVRAFVALLVVFTIGYTVARTVQVGLFVDIPRGLYPLRMSFDELAQRIESDAGDQPMILTSEREIGGNLLLKLPHARVCCTAEPLYPIELGNGPVVIAWNLRMTQGQLVPPWYLLGQFRSRYERPILPEDVRMVEVAPSVRGQSSTVIAYVVLTETSVAPQVSFALPSNQR